MKIGVPKKIESHENRVGLVPGDIRDLVRNGHAVIIESAAGRAAGHGDRDYEAAGVAIVAEEVFATADMIVKVKKPQPEEFSWICENQIIFAYLHLAPDPVRTRALRESGCIAIAYETVTGNRGSLPFLAPMSRIAGRLAVQVGAHCLGKS